MTLSPETVEELRLAVSSRRDIERVVVVERSVEPRSEPPFSKRQLVVVLEEPPSAPPDRAISHALLELLHPVAASIGDCAIVIPSRVGLEPATRGGTVVYDRGAT